MIDRTPVKMCDYVTNHLIQCDFCNSKVEKFTMQLPGGEKLNKLVLVIIMISILLVLLIC